MKESSDPITSDEWLLRRVHKKDFVSLAPCTIDKYAFKPNVDGYFPDETGISLYRHSCIEHLESVLLKTPEEKRRNYGIVRVSVAILFESGLTVLREDDEDEPIVPGHVVIPQLNCKAYTDKKDAVLPLMKILADFVNANQSVLQLPL